jgi:predicted HicB family RNase H-like nuclease
MKSRRKIRPKFYVRSVRFSPEDARLMKEAAARRRISVNEFIRLATAGAARKVLQAEPPPSPLPDEFIAAEDAA